FDFALLQELAGPDERGLLAAIKELIAAQLVVEESAERFAFRHALTRQAVAAELLARERTTLHRAIAEALARVDATAPDRPLSDLAYHHFEAGDWTKALEYGRLAAVAARRLHAPRAAIEHLTRSLQAAYHLARPPLTDSPGGRDEPSAEAPAGL